ncbi:MAG TPA: hypothetical protein VHX37_10030 [Acidobacteriaceae bacterium]|jgi:hypothetical protein|nr:hypothetical protein [Acidobacteriaceae bacterium]
MTDLIFAVAFVAMVATPAMVATFGGRKEYNPGPDSDPEPEDLHPIRPPKRPSARIVRPHSMHKDAERMLISDEATLPIANGRGMSNR